jgi:hypothetical protein
MIKKFALTVEVKGDELSKDFQLLCLDFQQELLTFDMLKGESRLRTISLIELPVEQRKPEVLVETKDVGCKA